MQSGRKTLLIRPSGASLQKALDFRTKGLDLILEAVGAREDWGKGVIDFLGPLVLDEELNQVSQRLGWVEVGGCG